MTKIEATVPDYLARQARAAAERERVPIDQIVALALSAQLAAWRGSDDMETRAKRANLAAFDRIMSSARCAAHARRRIAPRLQVSIAKVTRTMPGMRQRSAANPRTPMSRRKQLSTTHRLVWGLTSPIRAGSTPLHSSASR